MPRTLSLAVAFAGIALIATAGLSWLTHRGARTAMEAEFERRLVGLAATAASQVSAADVADAGLLGEEGTGYISLQLLLEQLRTASGAVHSALLDSSRRVLYDTRGPEHAELRSRLDTLARGALDRAYRGAASVTDFYAAPEGGLRAGLAPVIEDGRLVAVVVVEARPDYRIELDRLGRSLALTTAVIGLALLILGGVIFRMSWSAVRLERQLSRAENLAAMGRLTATLAHEIKNPLAIIRGSAQRLGKLDPEARRMADSVVEEVDRLSRTVSRYLQFARPAPPEGRGGDAAASLEATLGLLEGEFQSRRITVRRDPGTASAPVGLDGESLKQVFLNLLLNAVEAMPEGGRLEALVSESRGQVEVTIADDGIGMSPELLREIGQPFVTRKAQGTGLGLFLTRRLVESVGGSLQIESRLGEGTRCRVRLPGVSAAAREG